MYPEDSVVEGNQEMYVFSAQADSGQIVGLRLSGNTLQVCLSVCLCEVVIRYSREGHSGLYLSVSGDMPPSAPSMSYF